MMVWVIVSAVLMTSADRGDLETALQLARAIRSANPASEIGATIHGVSTIGQAKRAYEFLAGRCEAELSLALVSYGLLVDDLHVYRAIAAQRAIGFPVGHASAQQVWHGFRSRPTWRVLCYSAEEPPTRRGLVLVDAVDGAVLQHLVEDNTESWAGATPPKD